MELKIGLIGGSGLGAALDANTNGQPHYVVTPFGSPSSTILETTWNGVKVFLLNRHGTGHVIQPSAVPFRANIFALKQLGCTHIIASGAVGSLREQLKPRDLVIPDQIIDKTFRRDGTFFEKSAVHVEFAHPFCPVLRKMLLESAADAGVTTSGAAVHDGGCYVTMEGPAFSTRAESLMHRLWGGDLIGMTAMPEAKLAREAEIPYALLCLVTDYDSWRPATPATPDKPAVGKHELLNEIIGNLRVATDNAVKLLRATLSRIASDPASLSTCPATSALELAIWSDKSKIDDEEVNRLKPIWGKYFG